MCKAKMGIVIGEPVGENIRPIWGLCMTCGYGMRWALIRAEQRNVSASDPALLSLHQLRGTWRVLHTFTHHFSMNPRVPQTSVSSQLASLRNRPDNKPNYPNNQKRSDPNSGLENISDQLTASEGHGTKKQEKARCREGIRFFLGRHFFSDFY
jgi:hypothetical protein